MTILNGAHEAPDSAPPDTQAQSVRMRIRRGFSALYRYARRFAVSIGVTIAVILVSTITIDLGPSLKAQAERRGSEWLERKMTIGRLGVHIGRGRFVLDDLLVACGVVYSVTHDDIPPC